MQNESSTRRASSGSVGGDTDAWSRLREAASLAEFCGAWLAITRGSIPEAVCAVVLVNGGDGRFLPAAVSPNTLRDIAHLGGVAERALRSACSVVDGVAESLPGTVGPRLAYPVFVNRQPRAVVALELAAAASISVDEAMKRLQWGAGWLESTFHRLAAGDSRLDEDRAALVFDALSVANAHRGLRETATAVASELAGRLSADAVMIGRVRRNGVRLVATSNTAKVQKSRLTDVIEGAMEEALDRARAVVYPVEENELPVAIHAALARELQAATVVSALLPGRERTFGVLTCVFENRQPDASVRAGLLEAICGYLGPILDDRRELDHWIAGKAPRLLGAGGRKLFGPRHPAFKLATLALVAATAFATLVPFPHRVASKAVIEGSVLRAITAPFDGYVASAHVRPGDRVTEGKILAELEDRDLRLERTRWQSELAQTLSSYREALVKRDQVNARLASAQADQAEAQLALTEEKLARTRVTAPFDGVVVAGDLSQTLGSPVEKGKTLFELAPLDAYRVILKVDERDVRYLQPGQRGWLVLSGRAGERLPLELVKLTPISSQGDGQNFFRVEARLDEVDPRLRPGMEGVAKVEAGEASLAWISSRRALDWLQITLWRWMP